MGEAAIMAITIVESVIKAIKVLILLVMIIVLTGIAAFFYATKIEPYRLEIKSLTLQTNVSERLKVVQITDIQISGSFTVDNLKKVAETVNGQTPDIVLFTGDLYENYAEYHDDKALIAMLSSINAPYGKFAVWGNRDYGGGAVRKYESILQQGGFQLLCNEAAIIMLNGGEKLLLAGLDDALLGNPDPDPIMEKFQTEEYRFSILMTHEPDTADLYSTMGFDLIAAGHSHGGQVNAPFLPRITTSLAEKYTAGLYRLNEQTTLYVNSGIGTSRYPIRFGVCPEIAVFHLGKEVF